MSPLCLLNCLPVDLKVSFIDINGKNQKINLLREETRNIFDFDLQDKITLMLQIDGDGYSPTSLVLDTTQKLIDDEETIILSMKDSCLRRLLLRARISRKNAGFKVSFYAANCLINNSGENLLFFYKKPSE